MKNKKNKCRKCKKLIHREEVHEPNVGYFHPSCYPDWKKKKLEKEADILWHKRVLEEYGETCTFCNNEAYCGHHFYFKGNYPNLRYYIPNGIPICQCCHYKLHKNDPKEMEDIVRERRGKEWQEDIKNEAKKSIIGTRTLAHYEEIIKILTP